MSPKTKVEIFCTSNAHFLQRLYTGFQILAQQGEIDLSYRLDPGRRTSPPLESLLWSMNLLVKINGKLVLFDLNDDSKLWQADLEQVDFYFKRSFSAEIAGELAYRKVFPAGLSYVVYERYPSWFALRRIILEPTWIGRLKELIRTLGVFNLFPGRLYRVDVAHCHAAPDLSLPPAVIFMTRFWDPDQFEGLNREIVQANNGMRAACVRQLRREFGPRFLGGFGRAYQAETPREYADCLVAETRQTRPGNYLRLMRQYPIAVDTRGLNTSGHKFAEYLAFGRAIVSEKKVFEVPGLTAGKHFLEFTTPEACVQQVATLMENAALRQQLMTQAYAYYQEYMPPEVSLRRILATVTGQG